MNSRASLFLCLLALVACGKLEPRTAQLNDACTRNADCAENLVCMDGRCVVEPGRECEPEALRCNGAVIEKCRAGGNGWAPEKTCELGCREGACEAPVCTAGERRCEGSSIFECLPDGGAFAFVQACASGCDTATKECRTPECEPFSTACKEGAPDVVRTCNARGTAWVDAPCPAAGGESTCIAGECVPKVCGAGESRCRGDVREVCNERRTAFVASDVCAFGCTASGSTATCAQPACAAGEESCGGDALTRCAPDRRSFAFVQYCPSGCAATGGDAECVRPTCQPLALRCGQDAQTLAALVEQCRADGAGWEAVESCPQACASGACVLSDAGCTPGERRCNGREVQVCVRASTGATEWRFEERCLGNCAGSACDAGGACGCKGGGAFGDRCGSTTRPPITLASLLPAGSTVHADGVSTILVHSEPIVSALGEEVPDGTLVTFTHDGAEALFASQDADPNRAGLQRPTARGRARVVLRAPTSARSVLVQATIGGSCAGSLVQAFAAPITGTRPVYVAEDFSTTRLLDRAVSSAQWDAQRGRVRASPVFALGTGVDGDLTVSSGTKDLWDDGVGRGVNALALGEREAVLESLSHGFAPGDEALVVNVFGSNASTVGNHEFMRVLAVEGNRLVFTQAFATIFGNGTNADLSGQRVVVQRVPQFNNVTVEAAATLTSRSYANSGTGILAFRARGTVRVVGRLDAAERGLPAGVAQPGSGASSLNRLLLGTGQTRAGGGIVFVAARTLTVKTEGGTVSGRVLASSQGGFGGAVWLQGGALSLGASQVDASSSTLGQDGRVRLDYGVIESGSATRPAAFRGQEGAFLAQALTAYTEPLVTQGAQPLLRAVNVLGVIAGAGRPSVGVPAGIAGVHVDASLDNGSNWANADSGRVTFSVGSRSFRFRARLETLTDEPVDVYGVAFRLDAAP